MKLITLNAWGGRMRDTFDVFFKKHTSIDFWLFQEVYNSTKEEVFVKLGGVENPDFSLHQRFVDTFKNYQDLFCPVFQGIYGTSIFLKPAIEIIESGEFVVAVGDWQGGEYKDDTTDHDRKLQWSKVRVGNKTLLLMNTHLTHRPQGKQDSEKRLLQSKTVVDFIKTFDGPKILAGDFNLLPDTESIRMIERAGMRNLIREYSITSTRTEIYKKPARFADYVFISPDIKVTDFKVLPDVVSDHSPVYLEFEV